MALTFGTHLYPFLIRLHISSKYNDFGFKGYRKINFLRFFPDALGNKCDFDVNLGSSFEQIW